MPVLVIAPYNKEGRKELETLFGSVCINPGRSKAGHTKKLKSFSY